MKALPNKALNPTSAADGRPRVNVRTDETRP